MIPFYSKRNQVYASILDGRPVVEKHFAEMSDWEQENAMYRILQPHDLVPKVLRRESGVLVTEFLACPTLLDVLEEQERSGFTPEPWKALTEWLVRCREYCGRLPADGNLRNFLWDAQRGVRGIDLESFREIPPEECGAAVAAAVLAYDPANTPVKERIAALVCCELAVGGEQLEKAKTELVRRRGGQKRSRASGIVLAGGHSSRMGCNKAELVLQGRTLLQWQVDKLRSLGVEDIIISGSDLPAMPGTRVVSDEYPDRGPIGGLHACLKAARNERCLVVSVDAPLVPAAVFSRMMQMHSGGVTVLRHDGGMEPLIGVYASEVYRAIEPIIARGSAPVRVLREYVAWNCFDYSGPKELLGNCNTPEEFAETEILVEQYATHSLPL